MFVSPETTFSGVPTMPSTQVPTGAEKLIQCLEREGVEYIFGLSGGAAMPIFDALVESSIKLISASTACSGTAL